ncbi:MAG: hypothetical protein QOC96_1628 [Acidobacteriota bacterium]|jgi:hypothetical protein|nr:hypothetical protein [Acidobacteriota bacterium]
MRNRRIEIAIEELVLHGLDPSDRDGIREVIEREMERLFAERGVPPQLSRGGKIAHLDNAGIEVQAGSRAVEIGSQVARSLYQRVADSSGHEK